MRRHNLVCDPWNPPYGVEWKCLACGYRVCQSLVVLSEPERLRSTAATLETECSGSTAGASLRR